MITYVHLWLMAASAFVLLFLWRFWVCIDRLGYTQEVARRAPSLRQNDHVAAIMCVMPFVMATADWLDFSLPHQEGPINSYVAVLCSAACIGIALFALRNSGERLAGSWAGTRESALRTVAALRIIDATELAHALDYLHACEAERRHGVPERIIEENAREVRK